jgi:hypothetical protein
MKYRLRATLLLTVIFPSLLYAQVPSASNAELRARLRALEEDIKRLQSDYALLLTTCAPPATGSLAPANTPSRVEVAVTPIAPVPDPPQPTGPDYSWFIRSTEFGVTESNRTFIRFAYTVSINNGGSSRPRAFDITVQFLDENGLVVDTGRLYRQVVDAYGERTFRDDVLIRMPGALRVVRAEATATLR